MDPSFYEILGVPVTASTDDIRHAYKQKALETHPDKLDPSAGEEEKKEAEKKFHLVYESFETLSDPLKRRAYDFRMGFTRTPFSRRSTSELSSELSELSQNVERVMKERAAWARRQEELYRKRLEEIRERIRRSREQTETASASTEQQPEKEEEIPVVEQFVFDGIFINLDCKLKPHDEWERRKKLVEQRRAQRLSGNAFCQEAVVS
ncbi:hypothetical protein D9758_006066 [Tetrapyrgos nigripes]|uniref:J domain-containing protein n=1 Tax=Tetrapyrgos nigripes TaxID=182062 RepID=A0A8H5D9P9_9AGAR|nr:hypothetical protein D9758_006066 [Tetrapyrgos nigripes]